MHASNPYQIPYLINIMLGELLESIKLLTLWIYFTQACNNINKMDKTQDLSMISNKVGAFDTYKGRKAGKYGNDDDTLPTPPLKYFFLLLEARNEPKSS